MQVTIAYEIIRALFTLSEELGLTKFVHTTFGQKNEMFEQVFARTPSFELSFSDNSENKSYSDGFILTCLFVARFRVELMLVLIRFVRKRTKFFLLTDKYFLCSANEF